MNATATAPILSVADIRASVATAVEKYILDRENASVHPRPLALRHPLGFACLPVLRGAVGLCVHMWTTASVGTDLTTSPFHCHSWDLHSLVLEGSVLNQCLDVLDIKASEAYRVFEVRSLPEFDEIHASRDLVVVRMGETRLNNARDIYHLAAGVFHRTVVPGGEACTMVIGLSRPGGTDRSLGPPSTGSHCRRRRYCDPEETEQLAHRAAEHLRAATAEGLVERLLAAVTCEYVTMTVEGET
ncbi:hypothetical protein MXD63_22230 [Frankia sp. Cpl3]|nr:hypothetical protein [Frankia sp. Cpl3]